MKIAIISDTHLTKHMRRFKEFLYNNFQDVDMIVHVGDFKSAQTINTIKRFKPFKGVFGNNDGKEIRKQLKEKEIILVEGIKIGLFHGTGDVNTALDRSYDKFKKDKVDVIIFGHTHKPIIKSKNKILMLNPGSPNKKGKVRWCSYIILEIKNKKISANLVMF